MSESPSFGKSYSTRNILTRFVQKSSSFGKSYSTRNILTRFLQKSPTFGKSYSTKNILTRFVQKSQWIWHFWTPNLDREAFDSVEPLSTWFLWNLEQIHWHNLVGSISGQFYEQFRGGILGTISYKILQTLSWTICQALFKKSSCIKAKVFWECHKAYKKKSPK